MSCRTSLSLVVGCVGRVPVQDVDEVLSNDAVGLLGRVELVVEEERVGRVGRGVDAVHAGQVAVVLEPRDVRGRGAVEVLGWVVEDVHDLWSLRVSWRSQRRYRMGKGERGSI